MLLFVVLSQCFFTVFARSLIEVPFLTLLHEEYHGCDHTLYSTCVKVKVNSFALQRPKCMEVIEGLVMNKDPHEVAEEAVCYFQYKVKVWSHYV